MTRSKHQKPGADSRKLAVKNAYEHFIRTGDPIRQSARLYSVPESTLRSHVNNPGLLNCNVGHPTLFTPAEEQQLSVHIQKMAKLGYGYTRWQVCQLAENMLQTKGLNMVTPHKDWYYGFVSRMDLKIQKPKKRELARVFGGSQTNIRNYFHELESVLCKYDLMNKPAALWNVDETGITLDFPPPKIVSGKGEQPYIITSKRKATTTVIAAGNALGETLPPYVIYKGQRLTADLTTGCLPQSKFTMTQNGWSTSNTFSDFIQNHFLVHVTTRPCLLLYDGHATHITTDVIELARKENLHLFVLPPHSSHIVQPLDVGIFGPFKAALSTAFYKLCHSEIGRQVTRSDLPSLIAAAYKSAMTVPNLMSAFRKTGIVPFNPDIVLDPVPVKPCSEIKPKSRKERVNARNIKLLLTEIDSKVEKQLQEIPTGKVRQYIVPNHGAAVTEIEFVEKLKRKTESESKPKAKKSKICKEKETNQVEKKKMSTENKSKTPEIIDSQEAGPSSSSKKEWLTFYDKNDTESEVEDDEAVCVICGRFSPVDFGKRGQLEILNWAKCVSCSGWVHLKYCSLVSRISNEEFKCSKCS